MPVIKPRMRSPELAQKLAESGRVPGVRAYRARGKNAVAAPGQSGDQPAFPGPAALSNSVKIISNNTGGASRMVGFSARIAAKIWA